MDKASSERERLVAILDFWHKIEFFIPFDLSGRAASREGKSVFRIHAQALEEGDTDFRQPHIPADKELTGFTVSLGVFSKSEIADVVRLAAQSGNEAAFFEDTERGDLDGDTCFASLELDAMARPLFGTFAVSTLPWALGRVRKSGVSALSSGAFAESRVRLGEQLRNFEAQRQLDQPAGDAGDEALTKAEILDLTGRLCEWAGFTPRPGRPAALVEIRFRRKPNAPARPQLAYRAESAPVIDDEEAEDRPVAESEIGILNSFFIEDIERAIAAVQEDVVPGPLRQYLTPLPPSERIDLYTESGRLALIAALHPKNLNLGRWPGEPHHAMSLMQQFAINAAADSLEQGGLFSVNGPPGTGKTTLLRDIIADNLVRRARVLASLGKARDAFFGRAQEFRLTDGGAVYVSTPQPDLTGYEMVVASSNNSAVENISRDLPKREALSGESSLEYLQTVAHKIAAQEDDGSFLKLDEKNRPWGLIACTLGKSANRYAFKERFLFKEIKAGAKKTWAGERMPQTILQWIDGYEGPSFAVAAKAFRTADAEVEVAIARYLRYADLHGEVGLCSGEDFCRAERVHAENAAAERQKVQDRHDAALAEKHGLEARRANLQEEERLLDRSAPAWWHRLLATGTGRDYRRSRVTNAREQIAVRAAVADCDQRLKTLLAALRDAVTLHERCGAALQDRKGMWMAKRGEFEQLGAALGHPAVPEKPGDVETDRFQIEGLWHTDALARQRTTLFEAALGLHAAWLAEVGAEKGGFRGNIFAINKLLSGKMPVSPEAILAIWQSLFLIVPVVSTTFASFARQFQGVGRGAIGWLFVDEAGQAVPQAAVGALMRAQRAMVIGDPLQIEPVFTLPSALIEALAVLSPHTEDGHCSPNRISAQTLADAANRFGTAVPSDGGDALWIGSPLRVHRRCLDPMFSLANRIAYRDKMVYGLGERLPPGDAAPFYGDSAWIDIRGQVAGKQTVPEQVAFIVAVLVATVRRDGVLPKIYIISPFKETRNALKRGIEDTAWFGVQGERVTAPPGLGDWLKKRIGTVHTFQGKEESAVFMVLGADEEHVGAAVWASSKPNLLNVAATRAKRRFYIVGDRDLWKGKPYFDEAAEAMAAVGGQAFLAGIAPSTVREL